MIKLINLLIICCMLLFVGCETVVYTKDLNISKLEERVNTIQETFRLIPADDPNKPGYPWVFKDEEITLWFAHQFILSGSYPNFSPWSDSAYFVLEYENAIKSIELFSDFIWKFKFKDQARDCDDYSFAYKSWLQFLFADTYDVRAGAPVAVLYVNQKNPFGGVPGGDYAHALIGIGTDRGPIIMEPQSGAYTFLYNYPNKEHIYYVIR